MALDSPTESASYDQTTEEAGTSKSFIRLFYLAEIN